jgi:hypothetical protein
MNSGKRGLKMPEINEQEKKLLMALVCMAKQYLKNTTNEGVEVVDSFAMGAGEMTIPVLAEYGLVELIKGGRIGGYWTEAGNKLWEERDT